MDEFNKQKIIYQELSEESSFYLDKEGEFYITNTAYMMTGSNLDYLIHFLNSKIIEFIFRKYYSISLGKNSSRWLHQYIILLPIPKINSSLKEKFDNCIYDNDKEKKINDIILNEYHFSEQEKNYIKVQIEN